MQSILVDPVAVEDTEVTAHLANTGLSQRAQVASGLELHDTVGGGLAVGDTLLDRALAVATADTHAVDHVALLRLVAKAARLVRAGGARAAVDGGQLPTQATTVPAEPRFHGTVWTRTCTAKRGCAEGSEAHQTASSSKAPRGTCRHPSVKAKARINENNF